MFIKKINILICRSIAIVSQPCRLKLPVRDVLDLVQDEF
jgi:hypothetical protein